MISPFNIEIGKPLRCGAFNVTLNQEEQAENPWENWDCMIPIMTYNEQIDEYSGEEHLGDFFDFVTPEWISAHWRKLCDILDTQPNQFDCDCHMEQATNGGWMSQIRKEAFDDILNDLRPGCRSWGIACDYFETLAALFTLAKIPAISAQRNGYSQGDSVRILVVATPAHSKRMGYKTPPTDAQLETDATLYGSWAWGDVYYYTIDDAETGETVDSCGGFYGCYWDDAGSQMFQAIEDQLVWFTAERKQARIDRLKDLIVNRVPFAIREIVMGGMPKWIGT